MYWLISLSFQLSLTILTLVLSILINYLLSPTSWLLRSGNIGQYKIHTFSWESAGSGPGSRPEIPDYTRPLIWLLTVCAFPPRYSSRSVVRYLRVCVWHCVTVCLFRSLDCKLSEGREALWLLCPPWYPKHSLKPHTYQVPSEWKNGESRRGASAGLCSLVPAAEEKLFRLFQATQDIQRAAESHFPGSPTAAPPGDQLDPVPPGDQPPRPVLPVQSCRQQTSPRHEAPSHHQRWWGSQDQAGWTDSLPERLGNPTRPGSRVKW